MTWPALTDRERLSFDLAEIGNRLASLRRKHESTILAAGLDDDVARAYGALWNAAREACPGLVNPPEDLS